jgi:hypothetical protein
MNPSGTRAARRRRRPALRPRLEHLEGRMALATFTVANLDDAGAGSLRQAVADANNAAGADTIAFAAGWPGSRPAGPKPPVCRTRGPDFRRLRR